MEKNMSCWEFLLHAENQVQDKIWGFLIIYSASVPFGWQFLSESLDVIQDPDWVISLGNAFTNQYELYTPDDEHAALLHRYWFLNYVVLILYKSNNDPPSMFFLFLNKIHFYIFMEFVNACQCPSNLKCIFNNSGNCYIILLSLEVHKCQNHAWFPLCWLYLCFA